MPINRIVEVKEIKARHKAGNCNGCDTVQYHHEDMLEVLVSRNGFQFSGVTLCLMCALELRDKLTEKLLNDGWVSEED